MRESPSVEIMELLRDKGAEVQYSDPHVPKFPKMREHNFDLSSVELSASKLEEYDAVILATDHEKFDYDAIYTNSKLIIDTHGRYRHKTERLLKRNEKICTGRCGWIYRTASYESNKGNG